MAELIIKQDKEIAFKDYLKIWMLAELKIRDDIANYYYNLPTTLHEYKTKMVTLENDPKRKIIFIKLINKLKIGDYFNLSAKLDMFEGTVEINGSYYLYEGNQYANEIYIKNLFFNMHDSHSLISPYLKQMIEKGQIKITKNFQLEDDYFVLRLSEVYTSEFLVYPYHSPLYELDIESQTGKHDIYYYDPLDCKFYFDKGKKSILPQKLQEKLLNLLPNLTWNDCPKFIKDFIVLKCQNAYSFGNSWHIGSASLLEIISHKLEGKTLSTGFLLEVPEKLESATKIDFSNFIEEEPEETEKEENTKNIANSIKNMLHKLKENRVDPSSSPKIKIRNTVFYAKVSDVKKEIDPFFHDSDIIKYCDLSLIDFTNADIEGYDLSNTNAKIDLTKLYNRSIKNTNLRNVSLMRQDLDGILADGADLRGTNVFVSIEKTSIIGTIFSESTTFMLETQILTADEVRNLGIIVKEEPKEEIARVLKL